jgi:hypothetical protein
MRGAMACPTAQDMAKFTSHQMVERWSYLSGGRIKIDRTDVPGYEEEWEMFVVQSAFDFASDHFSQGDLLAYRRREPGNTFEASTLFRHLQRIDAPARTETEGFNRFTAELTRLLETDASTVMVQGLTFDSAGKICSRLANPTGEEAQREVAEWRKRNDAYFKGAASALNQFGERYRAVGGEPAKQGYFHMILEVTGKEANKRVMRHLGGATLDNSVVPPERACSGLAQMLHDGVVDFAKTPADTRALDAYMAQKGIQ